jgi:hypothetical protein
MKQKFYARYIFSVNHTVFEVRNLSVVHNFLTCIITTQQLCSEDIRT